MSQVSEFVASQVCGSDGFDVGSFSAEFPALFSSTLGTAHCVHYQIELSDSTPERSAPYRFAPPKMAIFRDMVNELLEQRVVRPSKSLFASPTFLVSKGDGVSAW